MKKGVEIVFLILAIGAVVVVALIIMGDYGKSLAKERTEEEKRKELEPYLQAERDGNYVMPRKSQP